MIFQWQIDEESQDGVSVTFQRLFNQLFHCTATLYLSTKQ